MLWVNKMAGIKIWALSLCGALVVTSIFRILMSTSSLNKSINIFLSMFIFLYSVIPLENIVTNSTFKLEEQDDVVSYEEYYKNGYENIVIEAIKNVCADNDVSVISIDIDSYIDENEYYCINNILLEINSSDMKEIIREDLKEKLGFEVNVY